MTFVWIVCGTIKINDVSDECMNGRKVRTHLTTGKEYSDFSVTLIANENPLNCSLIYTVRNDSYLIVVIEFLDWVPYKKLCTNDHNIVYVARCVTTSRITFVLSLKSLEEITTVLFLKRKFLPNRQKSLPPDAKDAPCLPNVELECVFEYKQYCMTSVVFCDGNINCGVVDEFDEDFKKCKDVLFTSTVIIFSLLMITVSFFLLVALTVVRIPKRKPTFIYKFDQTMTPFDKDNAGHFEIETQFVYPMTLGWNGKINCNDSEQSIDTSHPEKDKKLLRH
ncbi:hypothetical protein RUM44_003430 [Polyplax serrata]|uniref:CUB domain-containing protein n=1 Tax=Polyplax serrata TaxID=468196 RepID=A0ABR1AGF1_POLSC